MARAYAGYVVRMQRVIRALARGAPVAMMGLATSLLPAAAGAVTPVGTSRLCEDVYPDIERVFEDPSAAWLRYADVGSDDARLYMGDILRCQEPFFAQQNAPATVRQAARLHAFAGLLSYTMASDDEKDVAGPGHAFFCAARALDPGLVLPLERLPEDVGRWWSAPCGTGPEDRLPRNAVYVVDGSFDARSTPDQEARPFLLQRLADDGEVDMSLLIGPGDARPRLEVDDGAPATTRGTRASGSQARQWTATALGAAGAGLLASGVAVQVTARNAAASYGQWMSGDEFAAYEASTLRPRGAESVALIGAGAAAATAGLLTLAF